LDNERHEWKELRESDIPWLVKKVGKLRPQGFGARHRRKLMSQIDSVMSCVYAFASPILVKGVHFAMDDIEYEHPIARDDIIRLNFYSGPTVIREEEYEDKKYIAPNSALLTILNAELDSLIDAKTSWETSEA